MSRCGRVVRESALPRQLFRRGVFVIIVRERREKSNNVVDILLRQRQRLHVFIEPRVLQSIAFIVVVQDVPQRLLRTVVKVRPCEQQVAVHP